MAADGRSEGRGELDLAFKLCQEVATHYENFPVASRILPRPLRPHFHAVYAYSRGADDLADAGEVAPETRLAALRRWENELHACYEGQPTLPVFRALSRTIRTFGIPHQPFVDLVEAFRQDLRVRRYATRKELLDYCRRSADPVGRVVLHILGRPEPRLYTFADRICTALQIANFLQDVAGDLGRGRIYLPREDLERFGVTEADLAGGGEHDAFCRLLQTEVRWARDLFLAGAPLPVEIGGRRGLELRMIVLGGLAVLRRVGRRPHRVRQGRVKLTRWDRLALPVRAFAGRWPPAVRVTRPGPAAPRPAVGHIVRRAGSSFYYPMLLLRRHQRRAMFAVYAYARQLDDIADGEGAVEEKAAGLAALRQEIERALEGRPETAVGAALLDAMGRFPIRAEHLRALAEGVAMDLEPGPAARFATFDDLYPYCYRVAGVVGLLAVAIQGFTDPAALDYAETLGVALQLTNIIRDVGEDARQGRVYLPREELRRFGVRAEDLRDGREPRGFGALMAWQTRRARHYYERAARTLPRRDRRRLVVSAVIGRVYRGLLDRIEAQGYPVLRHRVRLPRRQQIGLALGVYLRNVCRLPHDGC